MVFRKSCVNLCCMIDYYDCRCGYSGLYGEIYELTLTMLPGAIVPRRMPNKSPVRIIIAATSVPDAAEATMHVLFG